MSGNTPHASFRLSADARRLLDRIAAHHGISRTAVLEWIIREKARELTYETRRKALRLKDGP